MHTLKFDEEIEDFILLKYYKFTMTELEFAEKHLRGYCRKTDYNLAHYPGPIFPLLTLAPLRLQRESQYLDGKERWWY